MLSTLGLSFEARCILIIQCFCSQFIIINSDLILIYIIWSAYLKKQNGRRYHTPYSFRVYFCFVINDAYHNTAFISRRGCVHQQLTNSTRASLVLLRVGDICGKSGQGFHISTQLRRTKARPMRREISIGSYTTTCKSLIASLWIILDFDSAQMQISCSKSSKFS